jgi:hypothetical protein
MDEKLPQLELSDVAPFVFKTGGEADTLFQAILENLEVWVDTESDDAISQDTVGEARVHACGRVSSIKDLQSQLKHLREQGLLLQSS